MFQPVCAAMLLAAWLPCAARAAPPHVLLIVADDLRAELGCYGARAVTPNIDSLSARGARFSRAYCQQAVCNPSRSSFLTGRRPDSLRLWSNGIHFRELTPDVVTLPQHFMANGYEARCVGKIFHNWHTKEKGDRRSWSAPEFLHYANHGDDIPESTEPLPPNSAKGIGRMYGKVPVCECRDVPDEAYYDGRVAAEAVRVLAGNRDKPLFLAVGFWKPHAPFNAPKKYWDLYDRASVIPPRAERPEGAPAIAFHDGREILGAPPARVEPNPAQVAEMRHGYLANISYLDTQVGKVLLALEKAGMRDNTVVVFLADHGYHMGELGLWAKTSCFERDARVPLIVSAPGMARPGAEVADISELVDLFPTLSGLCGLRPPSGLEGVDRSASVLKGAGAGGRAAFTQHPRPAYFDRTPTGVPEAMGYSARIDSGRYTEWRDWKTGTLLGVEYYPAADLPDPARNRAADPALAGEVGSARAALHGMFPPSIAPSSRQGMRP